MYQKHIENVNWIKNNGPSYCKQKSRIYFCYQLMKQFHEIVTISLLIWCPIKRVRLRSFDQLHEIICEYRCLWNTNAPFPNLLRIGLTFDLDLSPTDLNIDRVIYSSRTISLPSLNLLRHSVLELSIAQVVWETNMTFDLDLWLTDLLNIDRNHLIIMDYLPTKFEACWVKRSWVISCTRWSTLAWPLTLNLLTWISIGMIYSPRTIDLPSLKYLWQSVLELSIAQGEVDWHDLWLDLWPSDLNINRDHLLIKDYLTNKFAAFGAKRFWVTNCTR